MKKKVGLVTIIAILFFVIIAGVSYSFPLTFGGNPVDIPEPLAAETMLTAEQVIEDRDKAIEYMEEIHPYFILVEDQSDYEDAKQKYIQTAASKMTVRDFQAATAEYIRFFQDGHTCLAWKEEEYVDVKSTYRDGKTYIVEDNEIGDVYIESFGGVGVESIYEAIDKMFPAENEMAQAINRYNYVDGKNFLSYVGAEIIDGQITVAFSDGTQGVYGFYNPSLVTTTTTEEDYIGNRWYMDGDIFVVDFNTCSDDEQLREIASELSKKVEEGCTKIIIDMRGNGGGSSNACERLLEAMDMRAPQYDMVIRYSEDAKEQRGYIRSKGMYRWNAKSDGKPNENIDLVVLCDRYTFSSATMMCVYVRDGKLGILIGEPSSNMPNAYGDILYFVLPNSHLYGTVSHKQFIRPDETNNERMLVPEIQTTSEDAYDAAVKYLRES